MCGYYSDHKNTLKNTPFPPPCSGRLGHIVRLELPDREIRRQTALRELETNFLKDARDEEFPKVISELSALIADQTVGATGSNVIAVCNDAKLACLTAGGSEVHDSEMLASTMRKHILHC